MKLFDGGTSIKQCEEEKNKEKKRKKTHAQTYMH